MKHVKKWIIPGGCFLFLIIGCAGISQNAKSQVTYDGTFSDLLKDPQKHTGEMVLLGGKILKTQTTQTYSEILVLQLGISQWDRPIDDAQSEGRYLVQSDQFLDPEKYQKGELLTVVGKVSGKTVRPVGGFDYTYPVVKPIEIKLWPETSPTDPSFHFGFGIIMGY